MSSEILYLCHVKIGAGGLRIWFIKLDLFWSHWASNALDGWCIIENLYFPVILDKISLLKVSEWSLQAFNHKEILYMKFGQSIKHHRYTCRLQDWPMERVSTGRAPLQLTKSPFKDLNWVSSWMKCTDNPLLMRPLSCLYGISVAIPDRPGVILHMTQQISESWLNSHPRKLLIENWGQSS